MTNNLFNNLQVVSGEVEVETIRESFGLEVNGMFKMTKGNFQQEFSYYARLYETNFKNYIGVDDSNVEEEICNLGGLPIDSIDQLKKTLSESGLRTLADSLGFSYQERDKGLYKVIQNHKDFVKSYGKKAIVWNLLSEEEQRVVKIKHAITNYDTTHVSHKYNLGFVKLDDNGDKINNYVPTIEELKELLESLT
jgi:hypothetical protein